MIELIFKNLIEVISKHPAQLEDKCILLILGGSKKPFFKVGIRGTSYDKIRKLFNKLFDG